MLRARRIFGWFLVAAVACFAAALLAVNLYVQSQGTQERIQQELSQRLGVPLRIQGISVTPWGGLQLSGITIPQTNPAATPAFLEANSFRLRVQFRSIFQGPLVVKEVALIKPQVTWAQNESGKWRVPSRASDRGSAPPVTSSDAPPEAARTSTTPVPLHELRIEQPEIKRLRLIDGMFHFLDRQGHNVALFDGVEFSSSLREASLLQGQTRIGKIALRDRVFLSDLRAGFRYQPNQLDLSEIEARAAKGELQGDFSMQPQSENSPFSVRARFVRLQADQLVTEAGGAKGTVRGVLEGTLDASGKLADPAALTGAGKIALQGGHVQQFALLAVIGQILQIEELTQLDLEEAEAKYRLKGQMVLLDELTLRSPNLRLNAGGTLAFDGKLRLEAILTINDRIRSQLFRGMRDNFVASEDRLGEYSLPFHIGGTLEKPKTNLMERAVGVDLKNLGGVIDALFGRGKGKKKDAPEPIGAPTTPPAPQFSISPSLTPAPP